MQIRQLRAPDVSPLLDLGTGLGARAGGRELSLQPGGHDPMTTSRRPLGDYPAGFEAHPAMQDLARRATLGGGADAQPHPWATIGRWLESKPPFAMWFNRAEQITLAPAAVLSPITGFRVQAACFGVLRFFANATINPGDSPNVRYALLIDGTPMPGFARIEGPIAPAINAPRPMIDPLLPGQVVEVVATNLTSAAIAGVAAYIAGWYWGTALAVG